MIERRRDLRGCDGTNCVVTLSFVCWKFHLGECGLGLLDQFEEVMFHGAAICLNPSSRGVK